MKTFLISYDLWWPEKSSAYENLIKQIMSYWTRAKPLESFWFIKSIETTETIRNKLTPYLDTNDKIVVLDITWDNRATKWLIKEITDWMNSNI